MNIRVDNSNIYISEPTSSIHSFIKSLVYVDKSKQYQIRRMQKNPWQKNSPLLKQLMKEVNGELFSYSEQDNTYTISSCFYEELLLVLEETNTQINIQDDRKDTGATIALPWAQKPFDLRPYQSEAVSVLTTKYRGLVNMATGLGKSLTATYLLKTVKKKTLIVVPSESIALQFYDDLCKYFGKNRVGLYGSGKKKICDITVGIAASVVRNIKDFAEADLGLVIFDECHHTPATTFFEVSKGLSHVGRVFGLTATDYRSDGKDILITAGCGPVVVKRDIKWGIENEYLANPYFIVSEVKTGGRDFKDDKLKSYKEHVLNSSIMKSKIESDAAAFIASGKSVLVLVDEVSHGKELSEKLGIPFATGTDSKSQDYVNQLNSGKVKGLVGTDGKISEGTDTRNVDVLILANFVASKGMVIQAIGRALRRQGTKTKALIIDYIPVDSSMLSRHAKQRVKFYEEITPNVRVIKLQSPTIEVKHES